MKENRQRGKIQNKTSTKTITGLRTQKITATAATNRTNKKSYVNKFCSPQKI